MIDGIISLTELHSISQREIKSLYATVEINNRIQKLNEPKGTTK